jgi:Domain of unknown function (DUF4815)
MASLNVNPYYDDFDEQKNFHHILFRPGFSVQARELTQLQSILRNQIAKFGGHIFRQGSVVIPGNSRGELGVPYAKIEASYSSVPVNYAYWENKIVVGATSGVTAQVKKSLNFTSSDPITFYFNYLSGGVIEGVSTGNITFLPGEDIYLASEPTVLATIQSPLDSVGVGSLAYVNQGVYYVNGTFVSVDTQSTVISKYDLVPNCHVLLKITEEFVTSEDDVTLLDPAQGSYNFAAPGADRLKISLTLTTLPLGSAITDDYVEIMRYRAGVLEEHAKTPRYNELEKSLARRTYDESGDYVVSGLTGKISEHLRENSNGGISPTGDRANYAITVKAGKAYIGGFETEKISDTAIILPKARTPDHVKLKVFSSRPEYGRYIYISEVLGGPSLLTRQDITIWNDNDPANASATQIGSAKVLAIDYHIGDPSSNNVIYKLWVTDLALTSTLNNMDAAGGIRFTGGSAAVVQVLNAPLSVGTHNIGNVVNYSSSVRTALVRYWDASKGDLYVIKTDHTKESPRVGDQIVNATTGATSVVKSKQVYLGSAQNSAIFRLPVGNVKTLRNASNLYDYIYSTQKQLTITTNSSGAGSVTIASGTIQTPEVGTFAAFSPAGVVSASLFTLNPAGNTLTLSGGPVSTTVKIYATVDKVALNPRTKTLTTFIDTVSMLPGATSVSLTKADAYSIVSISDDTGDVTGDYTLVTGQTDYAYYLSSITLKSGSPAPTGNLIVTYKYFAHTDGDFFTIDSYALNTGYEDFVLLHRSQSTGITYNLKNCIDARPVVNATNDFGSGAIVGDMMLNGELFNSTIQYYVPRYDLLTLNKSGVVNVVQGVPAENPIIPSAPIDTLAIEVFFVPAYTNSVANIKKKRLAVDRFTMRDISRLSERVTRLEEFSTLSAAESSVVNYDVVDSESGLSRFKTGYLVETFDRPLTIGNIYDANFSGAFYKGTLVSSAEKMDCPVTLYTTGSSGYQVTNGLLSLPYTERTLASQPLSSRVTNLNPFLVIKWDGVLSVTPKSDTWTEVIDLPTIFTSTTEFVTVTRFVDPPRATSSSTSSWMPVWNGSVDTTEVNIAAEAQAWRDWSGDNFSGTTSLMNEASAWESWSQSQSWSSSSDESSDSDSESGWSGWT